MAVNIEIATDEWFIAMTIIIVSRSVMGYLYLSAH
jgi:hypothetical protein